MRAVLDTDALLSGIAYPRTVVGKILSAHRHGLSATEIKDLVDILSIQAEVIEPAPGGDPALADLNDQPVLGTLIAALQQSHADALTTGGKALLALADRYPIRTSAEFWTAYSGL
ncbi:MAG: hypothetical protein BGP21_03340 [Thiobacillus sp. 65-29]|jgi:predicted nucleic acid-binding protein|nr:MAG: hypothetical protein BGP21_03340 [Thiobacillus sp. 65-29]